MAILQQSYRHFEQWFSAKLAGRRIPVTGMLELTPECNLHCAHCYLGDMRAASPGMETAFVCDLLRQISAAGCFAISFTGGEPLLRPDYRKIHQTAHRLGFWINLLTNGVLIDASFVRFLSEFPPRAVEVSLYGGNADTYGAITGNPAAFETVCRNIDTMRDADINVVLKSVLLGPVLDSLDEMRGFARQRGMEILFDAGVTPDLSGDFRPTELRLAPACAVDIELDSARKEALLKAYHLRTRQTTHVDGFACGAGQRGFHVDYKGNLLPCLMLREPAFDLIHRYSFQEAWEAMGKMDRPAFPESSRCCHCDIQHLCGFCPGTVACGEQPPVTSDTFYCEVAQARLKKLL